MVTKRTGNPPGRPPYRGDMMMCAYRFPIDHADLLKLLSVHAGWTQTDLLCKGMELACHHFNFKLPDGFLGIEEIRSTRPMLPSERLAARREEEKAGRKAKKKARRKR